ncbi:MAG: hypothetical protein OXT67_12660 [Zetaproteobacteria bacterium]|nr:hypothetical protein [Zetaproteobacteria bacterium]
MILKEWDRKFESISRQVDTIVMTFPKQDTPIISKTIKIFEKIDQQLTTINYELAASKEYINLTPKNDPKISAIFYWCEVLRHKIHSTTHLYLGCQMIRLWRQLLHTTLPQSLSENQDDLRLKLNEKLQSIKKYTRQLEQEEKELEQEYSHVLLAKEHIAASMSSHATLRTAESILEPHLSLRARGVSQKLGQVSKPLPKYDFEKSMYSPTKAEMKPSPHRTGSLFHRIRQSTDRNSII